MNESTERAQTDDGISSNGGDEARDGYACKAQVLGLSSLGTVFTFQEDK
jgi:hypothetical protein